MSEMTALRMQELEAGAAALAAVMERKRARLAHLVKRCPLCGGRQKERRLKRCGKCQVEYELLS